MKTLFKITVLLSIIILILNGCKKEQLPNITPTYEQRGSILFNTNQASLNNRVLTEYKTMDVHSLSQVNALTVPAVDLNANYAFRLVSEVSSPVYQGSTIQATHVKIINNFAFVAYNSQGTYLGGVEAFDVSDIHNPKILWQAILPNVNINSIDYYNQKLYLTGATNISAIKTSLKTPAMLEVFDLDVNMNYVKTDTIIDLSSYAGTDVKVTANAIFTLSGAQGYLKIYNLNYQLLDSVPQANGRSLGLNTNFLYVFNGQPGSLNVYSNTTYSYLNTFSIGGANEPQAESQMAVTDKYIFTALNEAGVTVLNIDGSVKQIIPKPATPAGASGADCVSNAVSVNNDLVLIANGAAGLYVSNMVSKANDSLDLVGTIIFDDQASSNYVVSQDSIIFVATGLGGLKILTYGIDPGMPSLVINANLCPTLVDTINALFPNTVNNMVKYPQLFAAAANKQVVLIKASEVYVTFVTDGAGWSNTIGYYTYNVNNPPTSLSQINQQVLFPNYSSVSSGGGLVPGDMVQVGTGAFPAGTVIGFYLIGQGWANGMLSPGVNWDYTDPQFNYGNDQQSVLYIAKQCGNLMLNFKDMILQNRTQDFDFDDAAFCISDSQDPQSNASFNLTNVPAL